MIANEKHIINLFACNVIFESITFTLKIYSHSTNSAILQPRRLSLPFHQSQAGIASHAYPEQLLIALEPEAASICIRELRMRELQPEKISQRHKWIRTSMQKAGLDVKVSESITNGNP